MKHSRGFQYVAVGQLPLISSVDEATSEQLIVTILAALLLVAGIYAWSWLLQQEQPAERTDESWLERYADIPLVGEVAVAARPSQSLGPEAQRPIDRTTAAVRPMPHAA